MEKGKAAVKRPAVPSTQKMHCHPVKVSHGAFL